MKEKPKVKGENIFQSIPREDRIPTGNQMINCNKRGQRVIEKYTQVVKILS